MQCHKNKCCCDLVRKKQLHPEKEEMQEVGELQLLHKSVDLAMHALDVVFVNCDHIDNK